MRNISAVDNSNNDFENIGQLEASKNNTSNGSFVVNLLQKKTPAVAKIGTKVSSYRTIEEAKVRDSNDQPDAPKQENMPKLVM